MSFGKSSTTVRSLMCWAAVFFAATAITPPAHAGFHLWTLSEVYSNNSGTLQFIELNDPTFGSQQFVSGHQLTVSNIGNTITNSFTFPSNLPGDSFNHHFLIGTAGIQAAGGPAPDYIVPNGFLFQAGGSISFFNASGPYTALPTDGTMSRNWAGGNFAINNPTNFAGQNGVVTVPEPTTMILTPLAVGMYGLCRRLSRRRTAASSPEHVLKR